MKFAFRTTGAAAAAFLFLLTGCGGGGGGRGEAASNEGDGGSGTGESALKAHIEPVTPAVADAPYGAVLADCTFTAQRTTSCTLNQLPFIGLVSSAPVTVEDVMARVITSRPWMAQRLRELLHTLPGDLLQMMKPVTAIVVASKIRPSFYWGMTGAMYIDPMYLWTTPEEFADVDKTPDYRTDYGNALQFSTLWRYVKDDNYAYHPYPYKPDGTRTIEDIKVLFASLMVHELTHAGDFAPPRLLASLAKDKPLPDALAQIADQRISSTLYRTSPLDSDIWTGLARVLFDGQTATLQQKALTAWDVGPAFSADRATDDYSYASPHEDVAMLAEEALLRVYYGVSRDFAISAKPTVQNPSTADYVITWGTRGRIGEDAAKQAAAQVVAELLPNIQLTPDILAIPAPTLLPVGASWQDSLVLGRDSAMAAGSAERRQSLNAGRPVAADILKPY